jgi:hypothetical protein
MSFVVALSLFLFPILLAAFVSHDRAPLSMIFSEQMIEFSMPIASSYKPFHAKLTRSYLALNGYAASSCMNAQVF